MNQRREAADTALQLLDIADKRQDRVHDLIEEAREQVLQSVPAEHRPAGLFDKLQNALYLMRGRTRLVSDAAVVGAITAMSKDEPVLYVEQHALDRIPPGGDHVIKCRRMPAIGSYKVQLYAQAPAIATAFLIPEIDVPPYWKQDGSADYFVRIKVGDREVTPYTFSDRYKAEYEAAVLRWLLLGHAEPDPLEFSETSHPNLTKPEVK